MTDLVHADNRIAAMSDEAVARVRNLELAISNEPQADIPTQHLIHAGMYARTIKIPAGVVATGVLIKRSTILIVQGDVKVYVNEGVVDMSGYNVLAGSANRKQAVIAVSDVYMTMIFPTEAQTVFDAENEFTDEADLLITRAGADQSILITGE